MTSENPEVPVIAYEPFTFYSATVVCRTEDCINEGTIMSVPMVYSNNGEPKYVRVIDSTCNHDMVILTATKLDPQPPEE